MFEQKAMRSHLIKCLESQRISMFPVKKLRRVAGKVKSTQLIKVYCICRLPEFMDSQ